MSSITAQKTLMINQPAAELYRFWRNFENLPKFTTHLQNVQVLSDPRRSHWTTRGPLGSRIEWDVKILEDWEDRSISWISEEGADIRNSGFVRFAPLSFDRGTEVTVGIEYHPPVGAIGDTTAKLFGESPQQQIGDDLRRFKMLMETGEIATTEGQSRGQH
jgi:uncharacterized membrane protein